MTGRAIFLTYADERFSVGREILSASAKRVGFDEVWEAGPTDIDPIFRAAHAEILDQARGGGYWLWKPWLISTHLRQLAPDDILFYCDASIDGFYRFDRFPRQLINRVRASEQGSVIGPTIPQFGPLSRWTKREALQLLDADKPQIVSRPVVQATWSLWRLTDRALALADKWLAACLDPRILMDQADGNVANHPDFVDHRHDQSVLSILAYRDGYDVLDVTESGLFKLIGLRPNSEMAHRFLKAPRNVERLLRGEPALVAFGREALRALVKRRLGRAG